MIRWIKKIKERYNAYDDLIYVLSNDPAVVRGGKAGAARQVVTKLSPATAIKVREFINRNILRHQGIAANMLVILENYFDAEPRVNLVIRNFDHAVGLGWSDATNFVLEATDESREILSSQNVELTPEQETALIILGDAEWRKGFHPASAERYTQGYALGGAVREVVLARPHDIAAIIEIMQNAEIKHAAHLTAVLDGEIVPTLGAGVL